MGYLCARELSYPSEIGKQGHIWLYFRADSGVFDVLDSIDVKEHFYDQLNRAKQNPIGKLTHKNWNFREQERNENEREQLSERMRETSRIAAVMR